MSTLKDIITWVIAIITAFMPVSDKIYSYFTENDLDFVFSAQYTRNPLSDSKLKLQEFVKELVVVANDKSKTDVEKIAARAADIFIDHFSAIAQASNMPTKDLYSVQIMNLSHSDLKNVRVKFDGCREFDRFESWPSGSFIDVSSTGDHNPIKMAKLDSIPQSNNYGPNTAIITYIGDDAAKCKPNVQAELLNGKSAVGIQTLDVQNFSNEIYWADFRVNQRLDYGWKVIVTFFLFVVVIRFFRLLKVLKRSKIID